MGVGREKLLLAKEKDLTQRESKVAREESNQQFLGFQGGVPLLSKRPLVNGNLAMDKENNFLNVKRKYSQNPENRAKLHLPDVDWRNGYARPRLLSDLR